MSEDGRHVAWCTQSGCVHVLPVGAAALDPRRRPEATFRGQPGPRSSASSFKSLSQGCKSTQVK